MAERKRSAKVAVTELLEVTSWLAANLLPGTSRPYSAPTMSAEKRAELDAQNRLYRQVTADGRHTIMPLGESPAPLDLDVLDLLVDVLTAADELCDLVCWSMWRPVNRSASSAFTDPRPYLEALLGLLPQLPPLVADDFDVAGLVVTRCEALLFRANNMLGLITDGQLLDALCPWCDGRTSRHPVGGAKTLRVRMLRMGSMGDVPAIVCEGGLCDPPSEDVGRRWRGMPAWPLDTEGEWLAKRIELAAS